MLQTLSNTRTMTLPKPKKVTFPSLDLSVEKLDKLELNFHARINGPVVKKLVHDKKTVLEFAAQSARTTVETMMGKSRKHEDILARMLAAVYLLSNHRMSLAAVGSALGGKDHATVLNAHKRFSDWFQTNDHDLVVALNEFIKLLNEKNKNFSTKMMMYERKIKKINL